MVEGVEEPIASNSELNKDELELLYLNFYSLHLPGEDELSVTESIPETEQCSVLHHGDLEGFDKNEDDSYSGSVRKFAI